MWPHTEVTRWGYWKNGGNFITNLDFFADLIKE
jgi:hypothetical protein